MPSENAHNALSVTELNNYIKGLFDRDDLLSNVWIKGEISNFKPHSSGHMYFSLKDEGNHPHSHVQIICCSDTFCP